MIEVFPRGYRVLVEKIGSRKIGEIEFAQTNEQPWMSRFIVVAVGEEGYLSGGEKVPYNVKVGDEILFDARQSVWCGPKELYGDKDLHIVPADAILAVFKGEADKVPPKIKTQQPQIEIPVALPVPARRGKSLVN